MSKALVSDELGAIFAPLWPPERPKSQGGRRSTARTCRPLGGEATGKDPTNRGKLGTKRHIVVDHHGQLSDASSILHCGRFARVNLHVVRHAGMRQLSLGRHHAGSAIWPPPPSRPRRRPTLPAIGRGREY